MTADDAPTPKEIQAAEFATERIAKIAEDTGGDLCAVQLHAEIRDAFLAGHIVSVMERLPDPAETDDCEMIAQWVEGYGNEPMDAAIIARAIRTGRWRAS